jgi:hypothetical protein
MMAILIFLSLAFPQVDHVLPGSTLAWVLIGLATGLAGKLERIKRLMYYGAIATVAGIVAGAAVDFNLIGLGVTLIGFSIFVGLGLMLIGLVTEKALVTLGAYMVIGTFVEYLATPPMYPLANVAWLVLAGAALASFGYIKKSAFAHFLGIFFMLGVIAAFILTGEYFLV